jgi:oxygen-independent coproporphyrinogen III oxidase
MNIPTALISRFNAPVPRYTSYPPANFFTPAFDAEAYRAAIIASNGEKENLISLYLHVPFCSKLCYYCGCNTHISKDEQLIEQYMEALLKELQMIRLLLDPARKVSQIHWGGGTPNYLKIEQIQRIMEWIHQAFSFTENAEIAIECHPAHLDLPYIDQLKQLGFNRFSLGV